MTADFVEARLDHASSMRFLSMTNCALGDPSRPDRFARCDSIVILAACERHVRQLSRNLHAATGCRFSSHARAHERC